VSISAKPIPTGFVAIGLFLFFGAAMAGLAATTLIWHGTALDCVWMLNPSAYRQLLPLGSKIGFLFLLLYRYRTSHIRDRMVLSSGVGMETCRGNHRDTSPRRHHQPRQRRMTA
jgi:hypothetical protein